MSNKETAVKPKQERAVKPKRPRASVKVEARNVILYARVRPSVKHWFEEQAQNNSCSVTDVVEEIVKMFKTGRVVLDVPTS